MRAILQRVSQASVTVAGEVTGEVGTGLLVLLGVGQGDGLIDAQYLADKTANLRVFPDEQGKMNKSVIEAGGGVLVVSQFTLYGDCRKGRRPGFSDAAPPDVAQGLYEVYCAELGKLGLKVATGRFQTHMDVALVNDGPVTLMLDSRKEF